METDYMVEHADTVNEDVFNLPTLDAPPSEPDAHRAVITGVTFGRVNNEKQTGMIEIGLVSRDVPTLDQKLTIWVSPALEPAVLGQVDPKTLAPNLQTSYRISFGDKSGRAQLQRFVFNKDSIAAKAGRNASELGLKRATTIEEFASNINEMLQGLEVIMIRGERGGDNEAFKHNLEPKDILPGDEYETNQKRFTKKDGTPRYRLAWES